MTNRSLIGIIAAAILLLLAQLGMQGIAGFVFPNYYGSASAQSMSSLASNLAILAICAPFAAKLSEKFGKKQLATVGSLIGVLSYVICLLVKPQNAYVYVVFYSVAFVGVGFFNMVIWAMITDVIDDAEVRDGVREDGTIYAVYSFARKVGQALSSGLVGGLLGMIGYTQANAFEPEIVNKIFTLSCIVPIIGLAAVALALIFVYPLNKKRVEENVKILSARRNHK